MNLSRYYLFICHKHLLPGSSVPSTRCSPGAPALTSNGWGKKKLEEGLRKGVDDILWRVKGNLGLSFGKHHTNGRPFTWNSKYDVMRCACQASSWQCDLVTQKKKKKKTSNLFDVLRCCTVDATLEFEPQCPKKKLSPSVLTGEDSHAVIL